MREGTAKFETARKQHKPTVTRIDVLVGGEQVASTHDTKPETRITLKSSPVLKQDASAHIVTAINSLELGIPDSFVPTDSFDALDPLNHTELFISTGYLIDGKIETCQAAVMQLETLRLENHGDGRKVYVDMYDRAKALERSVFWRHRAIPAGANIPELINEMVQHVYPSLELVSPSIATGAAAMQLKDSDNRLSVIVKLAESIGHSFMFDADGVPTLVPPPLADSEPVATYRFGSGLLACCRELSREGVYNGVITHASSTRQSDEGTGEVADPLYAESWPNDVVTPLTYSQAQANVDAPGAFPLIRSTQLLTSQPDVEAATVAAAKLFALQPEALSMTVVPNPGLEIFDVIAVEDETVGASGRFTVGALERPLTGKTGFLGIGCNERRIG